MFRYSPTPWTPLAGEGRTTRVVDANDELVAILPFDGSNQNSALIVAAPYLLSSAREVDRQADAAPRGATVAITNEALDTLGRAIDIAVGRPGPGPIDEIPQDVAAELLDALRALRDHASRYAVRWAQNGGSHHHPVWAKVAAAIAKAEGVDHG